MHPEFRTVHVGNDEPQGYAVERNHNGEVQYLASQLDPSKIGRFSLDFAESTAKVLRYGRPHADERGFRWLPWPTAHLPMRHVRAMPGAAASL